jgi:transposase-like protein
VDTYVCEACHESFSREEGERLKAEEVERVRLLNVERLKKQ